jgi:hypothetical protein
MMKKKIFLLLLLFNLSIASIAQRAVYITIDGNTVPVDNLLMSDSVAAGRAYYSASFILSVTDDPSFYYIQQALQKGNANVSVFYTRSAGTTTERQYRSVALVQIKLPKLDAANRAVCKMEVKIRSGQLSEKTTAAIVYKGSKAKAILSSSYSVSMDNLPTTRVASITGLELKNNALISFEISARDIDAWSQWLNSPGKKLNGSIFLLAPDFIDKIKQIKLDNAELVSVTRNIIANDDRIERFIAVVKVADISMEDVK